MARLKTPSNLAVRVVEDITKTFTYKMRQYEQEGFMNEITPSLRFTVQKHLISQILNGSMLIATQAGGTEHFEQILQDFTHNSEIYMHTPESIVIAQGRRTFLDNT